GTTVNDLADGEIGPYADDYFEYDSEQRVAKEIVQGTGSSAGGGRGTYTIGYTVRSNPPLDHNKWAVKTVLTLPDHTGEQAGQYVSKRTVFTNGYAEVMLDIYEGGPAGNTQQWLTFSKYDAKGRVILTAYPSAVSGYDSVLLRDDLLLEDPATHLYDYLRDDQGLIEETFYNADDAPAGPGYFHATYGQPAQTGAAPAH